MKRILSMLFSVLLIFTVFCFPNVVSAEETVNNYSGTIDISTTVYADVVNSFLGKINTDRKKNGVSELVLDKALTEAAIQRSIELNVYYSTNRPNGESWLTTISGNTGCDKHIYYNLISIQNPTNSQLLDSVIGFYNGDSFKKTRDILLSSEYKSIGMAISLGNSSADTVGMGGYSNIKVAIYCSANNTEKYNFSGKINLTRAVEFKNLDVCFYSVDPETTLYIRDTGDTTDIKMCVNSLSVDNNTMNSGGAIISCDSLNFSSSDSSVVTVSQTGKIKAIGEGLATVTVSFGNLAKESFNIKVIDVANCRHNYDFSKPVIEVKPTCKNTGLYKYSCITCKTIYKETIPKTDCVCQWKVVTKPTLFTTGTKEYVCKVCSKVKKRASISKKALPASTITLSSEKKSIKVKYKKVKGVKGFQIRYKVKSKWAFINENTNWKYVTVNKNKSMTKVLKNLKKNKYFVQIRVFKKNNKGKKVYSNWLKKTVKVK